MRQLSDYELKAMKGGLSVTAGLVIGAIVIFLAGFSMALYDHLAVTKIHETFNESRIKRNKRRG